MPSRGQRLESAVIGHPDREPPRELLDGSCRWQFQNGRLRSANHAGLRTGQVVQSLEERAGRVGRLVDMAGLKGNRTRPRLFALSGEAWR